MYSEIPVLSFISAALTLVPPIWYLQAHNIAGVAIGIWLSVTNLACAVNALVWAEATDVKALVWCDISTSLITGSRIALPAACLSICIHLERLASFCETFTPRAKRRRIIFEYLTCFGLPVVYIALHLVVQPRRFDLFYGFGCRPATYPTIAAIFLVMLPPLLLTAATFVCAGIAWRHFLVHGVQFYGKRGSMSSLTRNLYLRLVGMALLEALFSAVLTTVVMWPVLSLGLAPFRNMSRDLSKVLVWSPEAITNTIRTVREVEWLVTVIQSVVFFGLFACRMEVARKAWELIRSILASLKWPNLFVTLGHSTSEHSSTSITVPTSPFTEVDLSLIIQSASTLTLYGRLEKSPSSSPHPLCPLSPTENAPEDVVISVITPDMVPLESPSRTSAIASSHNSLEFNFDPDQLALPPDAWPRVPRSVPTGTFHARSVSMGYDPEQLKGHWVDMDVPMPQTAYVRSCSADFFDELEVCASAKRRGICVTVVRET